MTTTFVPPEPKGMGEFDPTAMIALEKYMEWLNLWLEDTRKTIAPPQLPMRDLTIEDFFRYGETRVLRDFIFPWGPRDYLHSIISAGYGDDGGPAVLFATFEKWDGEDSWQLVYLVQEFDTGFSALWDAQFPTGHIDLNDYHRKGRWLVKPETEGGEKVS